MSAIASYIREQLASHSTSLGGTPFRWIGGGVLYFVAVVLALTPVYISGLPRRLSVALSLTGISILLLVFFVSWDSLFPGTAIYSGSASFIDRNIKYEGGSALAVRCNECGAFGPPSHSDDPKHAIFAWNQRMGRLTVARDN